MTAREHITLALCGDVMTGRGVDQALPHPGRPDLHEPYARSAVEYVRLAERANGPIPRPVAFDYVWGDALPALDRIRPDAWIINLETAVTTSEDAAPKSIHYRMHPANAPVLEAAPVDACVLANNHVLDWGEAGLVETLEVLERMGIPAAGAGRDAREADRAVVLALGGGGIGARLLLFAFGAPDSGIPRSWAAGPARPGVNLLPDFSDATAEGVAEAVRAGRLPGDVVVVSIHWGSNWGYEIPPEHRRFAHALVDRAGADVVHGHSSHHPRAVELYRGRPILYGCGDFLSDYEGIGGHDEFRDDLVLLYFATLDRTPDRPERRLSRFEMVPFRLRNLRLNEPSPRERAWLRAVLDRECGRFGGRVELRDGGRLLELR